MSDYANNLDTMSAKRRRLLEVLLKAEAGNTPRVERIGPGPRTERSQLSFAQQRLWFLEQYEPNGHFYNIANSIELTGRLDIDILRKSINEIVRRHEVLRTTFISEGGQPFQVVSPVLTIPLAVIDLTGFSAAQKQFRTRQTATDQARQPFDMTKGPLLRTTLLRLSEQSHILILIMHHIVSDGWSIRVFLRELGVLYSCFCAGQPSPLADPPIQYRDFAQWQRQQLGGQTLAGQLAYWRQQLEHRPGILELPTDRARPAVQTHKGAREYLILPRRLARGLKELSCQANATLFMTLLAAFGALLYRYSGQEHIQIGTPAAGRKPPETEELIGLFVNTLVMCMDFSGNPPFREVLDHTRKMALAAYDHEDVPFEKLVEELRPQRSQSHSPLFQVMFQLRNAPAEPIEIRGLTVRKSEPETGAINFDLDLIVAEENKTLRCSLGYNRDLFEAHTIRGMLGHLRVLVEAITADPDKRICELGLLTEIERHKLLIEWNNSQREYRADRLVHQLFEEQVEKTPDSIAVVFEDQKLTYRELNQRANQLAHYLRKLGAGPEVLVGIFIERSLDMVVGLLGILKAGAGYVPLDPSCPRERLSLMIKDSQVAILLTQKRLDEQLGKHEAVVVHIDANWRLIEQAGSLNPEPQAGPDNLAYVIFTSGSTGRPKGVQISHGSLVNFLLSMRERPGLTQEDVLLAVTTISFDIAALEIYLPLIVGARILLASHDASLDASQLGHLLKQGATTMQATPATWRMLLAAGWQGNSGLRILCGGEALSRELAHELLARGSSVWNLYGPTEATVWASVYEVTSEAINAGREATESIGRPIANTQFYILDAHLEPVPVGVAGQLHIGGAQLARGYLNSPDLTASRFIPNPFSDEAGARLYRTGDLARYLPDGNVEFLGRLDHQVKIRGFRIELGEIEAVLSQAASVRECAVAVRQEQPGQKRLVAYLVPQPESTPEMGQLRTFLKDKLPDYMIPSAFVVLHALPLTASGKVDRNALPEPDSQRPRLSKAFVAPRTQTERLLASIWKEIIDINQVGVYDDFFELGGHSLLATRIIARIRDALQVDLPLRSMFDEPNIAELAQKIGQELRKGGRIAGQKIVPIRRDAHRVKLSDVRGEKLEMRGRLQ